MGAQQPLNAQLHAQFGALSLQQQPWEQGSAAPAAPAPKSGNAQGMALLALIQGGGGARSNGSEGAALGGAQALPPAATTPAAEQAVSSLFGGGGSIWSSGGQAAAAPAPPAGGGSLWGDWAQPPQQQHNRLAPAAQQQHPPHLHPGQPQQQHGLAPPPGFQQPLHGMPPPMQQPQGQQPPAYQPLLHQQGLHLVPQAHLGPPQHPGLRGPPYGLPPPAPGMQHQQQQPHQQQYQQQQQATPLLPQGFGLQAPPGQRPAHLQQQQQQQHLPPHLSAPHLQQQVQQYQQYQQQQQQPGGPRPVQPYSPLAALLQSQPGAPQQPPASPQHAQPPQAPPPGGQPGVWGPGGLFSGLPAMQQLAAQQQQQQQSLSPGPQHPAGLGGRQGLPADLHALSPTAHAAALQQHRQSPPQQALENGRLTLEALLARAAGSPPPVQQPRSEQRAGGQGPGGGVGAAGGSRQVRHVVVPARKPGTQHVPKSNGRENRWVDVMDRQHDGRRPRADMQGLDAALRQIADSLMPTPEEHAAQLQAFEAVRSLLQARYPGARVHLFGSVANGLSVRHNNDIDVCLELEELAGEEDQQAAKGEVATVVGELMEAAGMSDVLTLPKARVPVVKFVVPRTGTKVDVTVNNMLACVNTKLLADYCAIDPRLAPLVALVKHWAKQRQVNDPYRGTLSSYCYVLMCIHLLQTRSPPVLPALQQLPPTFSRTVGQWTCSFCDNVEALRGFGAENRECLAELLWAFFEYWAWRHNYSHDVVSIRLGGCLHKDDKDWTRRIGNERHLVCIEDPFELSHDLGRTVDRQTRAVMQKEFTRAATLLRDSEDPLDALFSPYKVGHRS